MTCPGLFCKLLMLFSEEENPAQQVQVVSCAASAIGFVTNLLFSAAWQHHVTADTVKHAAMKIKEPFRDGIINMLCQACEKAQCMPSTNAILL